MLIIKSLKKIPSRKIVYDLAIRNGLTNPDDDIECSCPYEGQQDYVRSITVNAAGDILAQLKEADDFDASKLSPEPGPYRLRSDSEKPKSGYLTRLEDIDISWVLKSVEWALFNTRFNKDGLDRHEQKKYKTQEVYVDEEDGDMIEQSELKIESDPLPIHLLSKYHKKLPYILKRLSRLGARHDIHMMSLIIAYEKAKKYYRENKDQSLLPRHTSVLQRVVYIGSEAGGYAKINGVPVKIEKNEGEYNTWGFPFVRGDIKDEYYNDYIELLKICSDLRIDLTKEDPLKYDDEFINNLTVTYIMSNKEYLNKIKGIDIINSNIDSIVLEDYNMQEIKEKIEISNKNDILKYSVSKFYMSKSKHLVRYRDNETLDLTVEIQRFISMLGIIYKEYSGISLASNNVRYVDGFLAYKNTEIIKFKADPIVSRNMKDGYEFIIHKSGIIVLLVDAVKLYYLDVNIANNYLTVLFEKATEEDIDYNIVRYRYKVLREKIKRIFPITKGKYGDWMHTYG